MSRELRFRLFWGEANVNDVLDKAAVVVVVGGGGGGGGGSSGGGGGGGGGVSSKIISSMNLPSTSQDKMLPAA
jgi:hypothetical protein